MSSSSSVFPPTEDCTDAPEGTGIAPQGETTPPSTPADTGPARDPELWFDDGNIVLIATEGPQRSAAFRVYRGVLARVSPVFKDLFAVAQPDAREESESFDGCPAVSVADTAIGLRHFLRVLFGDGASLDLDRLNTLVSFSTLASIARIAHKYQADKIALAALSRIARFFLPHQAHWIDFARTWKEGLEHGQIQCALDIKVEDAVQAANLARLFDKPLMLPLALYLCCLIDPLDLRNGVVREDGVTEKLSDDDYVRCIRAIPCMARECHSNLLRTLTPWDEQLFQGCSNPDKCKEAAKAAVTESALSQHSASLTYLFVRADRRGRPNGARRFRPAHCLEWACNSCLQRRSQISTLLCREAWRKLPQWLRFEDLKGWQ